MEQNFSNRVNKLYLICTIFVVLIHANNLELFALKGVELPNSIIFFQNFITDNLARVAVPMFMFLSAFLMYQNLSVNNIKNKLKRRIKTLILPYVSWNTLYMIVFYLLSFLPFINTPRFQLVLVTIIKSVIFYAYNNAFWFMFQLIIYTLLCPFIYFLLKRKSIGLITIVSCYLAIFFINIRYINFMSLFFYLIGVFCALHYKKSFIETKNDLFINKCYVAFFISQILWILNYFSLFQIEKSLIWLVMLFSVYFLIDKLPISLKISKIHFFIYSSHVLVLEILEKINFMIFPYNALMSVISFILLPIVAISLCYGLAWLLKRYAKYLYCILTGESGI